MTIAKSPTEPYNVPAFADLEALTGAACIVSPLQAPVAPATIPLHVQAGALLVHVQRTVDLLARVGDRLWESLARMRATGARQWQCVLLTTGVCLPAKDGRCVVAKPIIHPDGRITWEYLPAVNGTSYHAVESTLRHWAWYGGVVVHLPDDSRIEPWLRMTESHLLEHANQSTKLVYPALPGSDDPLVTLQLVRDWRVVVAAFPGVGMAKATSLREAMLAEGAEDTLLAALMWITDGIASKRARGWGKGLEKKVRQMLGLEDGQYLDTYFHP